MGSKKDKKDISSILIPAVAAIVVAIIGGVFGLISPILLEKYKAATEKNTTQVTEDLSPYVTVDPSQFEFISGPVSGLYLREPEIVEPILSSWSANIDNVWYPAESNLCLINRKFPLSERRPLNLLVHSPTISTSIYWENSGAITITSYSLIITYKPIKEKIGVLQIIVGGLGGPGFNNVVFVEKEMPEVNINPSNQLTYNQEIKWINLGNKMGVTFLIPLNFKEPGYYTIQEKFNAILSSNTFSSQSRQITLTTGEVEYSWIQIDDPRKYNVDAGNYGVELIPCP